MPGTRRWDDALQRHADLGSEEVWQVMSCDREVWGAPLRHFREPSSPQNSRPAKSLARGRDMMQKQEPLMYIDTRDDRDATSDLAIRW